LKESQRICSLKEETIESVESEVLVKIELESIGCGSIPNLQERVATTQNFHEEPSET
jgi:hypothetical protein